MQGVQFSIGLDNSRLISGNKQVQNSITDTGKLIESIFGQKLKQVISIVTIEEATRRTAEWAQQIEQTSKNLGITAEQLQTLNHIASATGTADSAVQELFNNIQKSAQEALSGNNDVIQSFKKMGITIADIKGSSQGQLFSKVMGALPEDIRTSQDQMLRTSYNTVTGTPENTLQSVKRGYDATPGKDLSDKATGLINSGAIAGEGAVQSISATWSAIITDLKEAGVALLPIANILLAIVKIVLDAFNGILELIGSIFGIIKDLVTGNFDGLKVNLKNIFGLVSNAVMSIPVMILKLAGSITGVLGKYITSILGKIPGVGSWFKKYGDQVQQTAEGFNKGIDDTVDKINTATGIDGKTAERGAAIGNVASMIVSGGESSIIAGSSAGSYALRGLSAGAGKIGIRGMATWAATKAENIDEGMFDAIAAKGEAGDDELHKLIRKKLDDYDNAKFGARIVSYLARLNSGTSTTVYQDVMRSRGYDPEVSELGYHDIFIKIANDEINKAKFWLQAKKLGGLAAVFGTTTVSALEQINKTAKDPNNTESQDLKPIQPRMSWENLAGGSTNLKIGGMFGTGYNTIIKLNQKMVEHLAQISLNTTPKDMGDKLTNNSIWNGLSGPAGGL